MSEHLQETDRASAAVAVGPRVSLTDIERAIAKVSYNRGFDLIFEKHGLSPEQANSLEALTVCLIVMKNGFTVLGKAAPASPENFNAEVGRKFAYEDAIRQIWPLMGFALKDRLHGEQAKRSG